MRGKYQRIREARERKDRWLQNKADDLTIGVANAGPEPTKARYSNKSEVFSPGLMKYDGGGRFTFYRVKPRTIIKFIWSIFIHGKPGPRKNKRIR